MKYTDEDKARARPSAWAPVFSAFLLIVDNGATLYRARHKSDTDPDPWACQLDQYRRIRSPIISLVAVTHTLSFKASQLRPSC
jgi:hypothetical protein